MKKSGGEGLIHLHWCTTISANRNLRAWPYCGANRNSKFTSLALLRSKPKFEIFELGLIAEQIEILELGLIVVQIGFQNFRAWPHCGENRNSKFSSLALLRCKLAFKIFELGLIRNTFFPCISVFSIREDYGKLLRMNKNLVS